MESIYYDLYRYYKSKYIRLKGGGKGDKSSRERKRDTKSRYEPFSQKHIRQLEALRQKYEHQRSQSKQENSSDQKSKKVKKSRR